MEQAKAGAAALFGSRPPPLYGRRQAHGQQAGGNNIVRPGQRIGDASSGGGRSKLWPFERERRAPALPVTTPYLR